MERKMSLLCVMGKDEFISMLIGDIFQQIKL